MSAIILSDLKKNIKNSAYKTHLQYLKKGLKHFIHHSLIHGKGRID